MMPNMMGRQLIAAWGEQNGVPVPVIPKPTAKPPAEGGGAAAAAMPLLQKPVDIVPKPHEGAAARVRH